MFMLIAHIQVLLLVIVCSLVLGEISGLHHRLDLCLVTPNEV